MPKLTKPVHGELQAVTNELKKRGFDGFKGDSFRETPSRRPLQGMGSGEGTGYSGFYFNYQEIFLFDKNYYLIGIIPIVISLETFLRTRKIPKNPQPPVSATVRLRLPMISDI